MAGWLFCCWGAVVAVKGLYDLFIGEPEANHFSPQPWEFVTRQQWSTWSGFELAYGLACIGIALLLWRYAAYVPEWTERPHEGTQGYFHG